MGGGVGEVVTAFETVLKVLEKINPTRSAVITVVNHTGQLLWRIGQNNDHGGFATLPADSIPAGGSDSFGVRDAENSFMTGVEGWVKYNAGGMGQCEWRVHWDVPAIGANSADHVLAGAEASHYSADEVWGNGHDKVPFRFTLVGGPKPPPPAPAHPDPAHPEPAHPEPAHPDPAHPDPAHPDPAHPDPAHPDPAHPDPAHPEPAHAEVVGPDARWGDRDTSVFYDGKTDRLIFYAINAGKVVIMPGWFRGECQITKESGEIVTAYLDMPNESPPANPGEYFMFVLEEVYQHIGPGTHQVQAYLPQELGADFTSGYLTIEPDVH